VRAFAPVVVLFVVGTLAACSADTGDPGADNGASDSISVPDVVDTDGADAVTTIEDAGLTASLIGTDEEPSLDATRDPAGCTVEDQDPASGTDAAPDDEVTVTIDCRQVDWEGQEGDAWDEFNSRFIDGYADGCTALFDLRRTAPSTTATTSTPSPTARTSTRVTRRARATCRVTYPTIPRPPGMTSAPEPDATRSSRTRDSTSCTTAPTRTHPTTAPGRAARTPAVSRPWRTSLLPHLGRARTTRAWAAAP
jgi:hypothetical protein